jgi:hypothetical protein
MRAKLHHLAGVATASRDSLAKLRVDIKECRSQRAEATLQVHKYRSWFGAGRFDPSLPPFPPHPLPAPAFPHVSSSGSSSHTHPA